MNKKIIYIIILLVFFSCKKDKNTNIINNYYFLKIDDVALPVNIIGNKLAEQAIIYINDGLTTNINNEKNNIYWSYLEKNYKVVFYDQRGSGTAQGNAKPEDMSIERLAKDLKIVVDFAFEIGKVNTVFLHGVGMGAAVACYYLLDSNNQNKINGFIAESPAYDLATGLQLSKLKVLALADTNISKSNNIPYWQNQKNYYTANPDFTSEVFKHHINLLAQNNGFIFNINNVKQRTSDAPNTPFDVQYKNNLNSYTNIQYNNQYFSNINMTPELYKINIPIYLAWGGQNLFLPKEFLALNFKNAIGSNVLYNPAKYVATGHVPHAEDFLTFQLDVNAFIDAYK